MILPRSPWLIGRRTHLAHLDSEIAARLHRDALAPSLRSGWPLHGQTPGREQFQQMLGEPGIDTFGVRSNESGAPLGAVFSYRTDLRSQHTSVAVLLVREAWSKGWPLEGLGLFVNLLFGLCGMRKLYFEMSAERAELLSSALDRWLTEEIVLPRHRRDAGAFTDLRRSSLSSSAWPLAEMSSKLGVAAPGSTTHSPVGACGL
jgi:hypothetical protein